MLTSGLVVGEARVTALVLSRPANVSDVCEPEGLRLLYFTSVNVVAVIMSSAQ